MKKDKIIINEEIKDKYSEVRIIFDNKSEIMSIDKALEISKEINTDLILVSESAKPPVCKIMELGRYKYEQNKKQKKSKNANEILKQIKFSPNIDIHDYQTKLNHIKSFIQKGNKIRVIINFHGRELNFINKGNEIINKIINDLNDISEITSSPKLEGKELKMDLRKKYR